jgi:hypothetical protein
LGFISLDLLCKMKTNLSDKSIKVWSRAGWKAPFETQTLMKPANQKTVQQCLMLIGAMNFLVGKNGDQVTTHLVVLVLISGSAYFSLYATETYAEYSEDPSTTASKTTSIKAS